MKSITTLFQKITLITTLLATPLLANASGFSIDLLDGIDQDDNSEAVVRGSGCQDHAVWLQDSRKNSKNLTVQFYNFMTAEKKLSRKSCVIALPVQVPAGYKLTVMGAKISGASYLPGKSRGKISAEIFAAGKRGPRKTFNLRSNNDGREFIKFKKFDVSSCGVDTTLRINTSVLKRSRSKYSNSFVGIDSLKLKYKLTKC